MIYGNSTLEKNISASDANITIYGKNSNDKIGSALATGDVNGDGKDELIIGATELRGFSGEAYLINGSSYLPSIIDLSKQSPNITIYGADGHDRAGHSVLISDINGDNKGDIILSAIGAEGRNYEKIFSGQTYIILSGGKLLPLPRIDSIELKNGAGIYNRTCYARYYPYLFRLKLTIPNTLEDIDTVTLSLAYDYMNQNLQYSWLESTREFSEVWDPNNYVQLSNKSKFETDGKKFLTLDFYMIFNWTYPDNEYHTFQIQARGDTGLFDQLTFPTEYTFPFEYKMYRVENHLNLIGNVTVTGEYQGEISSGDWIHGGEQLTWGGFEAVYEGADEVYPHVDSGMTITVCDSNDNSWTSEPIAGNNISLITTVGNETKLNEKYSITITGVPATCSEVELNFMLNIDADNVTFHNFIPDNETWQTTPRPQCGIRISDSTTSVDPASVQYRISTDIGNTWNNWTNFGVQLVEDGQSMDCNVRPILMDGKNNLIQWRARDIVGNNYAISDPHRILIDISTVEFINPTPSSNALQYNLSVVCSITIIDYLSGVNASSIEVSKSTTGVWGYRDWQSANQTKDGNIINCSVTLTFTEGV
ncbi:MAG: FG-GAP repeat protein, partial [Thermoplasmata archaeon]|nr:FG-GAP repeat protein [Thermoplasmata archaeon]